ncbi:MAG: hypothetical protein DWQ02_19905 [Bacteroidetes bacterium]|nr:MAG: hypothetical protein DWQ02_19905 [Bacteroidota bacterium]
MRLFYLVLFLFCSTYALFGQNYYVALVKGKVYYQDKLLKKKDKIKMKGVLRFTSMDDYVKFSGPGGLYTIGPGMDRETSNEFLVAVKEEFFPKIRSLSTSENDIVVDPRYYFNQRGFSGTFLEKTHFYWKAPDLKPGEELGYLHETDQGLFYKTAVTEDSLLIIRKQDFSFPEEANVPNLIKTAIVKVQDKQAWLKLIQGKKSIAHIQSNVDHHGFDRSPTGLPGNPGTPDGEYTFPEPIFPATILDYMGPPVFVNRKAFVEDLRFQLNACKAQDINTFLEDYGYAAYIFEVYGNLRDMDIIDVLQNELKLKK